MLSSCLGAQLPQLLRCVEVIGARCCCSVVQIMLPGDLICKFMKERLEENLGFFRDLVKRDLDRQPEKVNLQVGTACTTSTWSPGHLAMLVIVVLIDGLYVICIIRF